MKHIEIINGPNLNLTGRREPDIYGRVTMEEMVADLRSRFPEAEIGYYQSNVEGEIINRLQEVGFTAEGIILNAGGYSHTSVAIHDAIAAITTPVIEVHISNIFARLQPHQRGHPRCHRRHHHSRHRGAYQQHLRP